MGKSEKKRKDKYDSDSDRERKERKKQKKSSKIAKEMGYSNEQNPFNDTNLTEKFVWHKNKKTEKSSSSSNKKRDHHEDNREELVREIMKVRKRRDERDAEREEMDRLKNEEIRLRESSQYEDWQQKEEEFHLSQARVRSHVRIREGREKPIDLLAKNLMLASTSAVAMIDPTKAVDDTLAELKHAQVEMRPPEQLLDGLDPRELDELRDSIQTYIELEGRNGEHYRFWKLLHIICTHQIEKQHKKSSGRGAIHRDVEESINEMLDGKSLAELSELKHEINATIAGGSSGIDVEYYENVLQEIIVYQAKGELRKIHESLLQRLDDRVKEQENNADYHAAQSNPVGDNSNSSDTKSSTSNTAEVDDSREAVAMFEMEMEKGMDEEEVEFVDEVISSTGKPTWISKYRPRKPRYFNRVRTGYDWNKYNQTHYDEDNPPPKIVQGYKFNIFYPDLLDKQSTPKYTLEHADSPEFCILRFHAGPPYLDIAFKVVNLEWEFSHKRGFKCVYERGILHLHFNFRRHRYRR